jgi:hypothetical protein
VKAEYERSLELGMVWVRDSALQHEGEFPEFDPYRHRTWHEGGVLAIVARTQTWGPVIFRVVADEVSDWVEVPYVLGSGRIALPSGLLCVRFTDAVFPDDRAPAVTLPLSAGDYVWRANGNDDGSDSSLVVLSLNRDSEH